MNDYFSRVAKNFDGLTFQILLEKRKSKGSLELVAGSFQSLLWSFLRQTVGTKLRENYLEYSEDCDALGQLLEMVTVTGTVVTVNNQVEWVATIFSKRFDDGQDMEEWISSRKRVKDHSTKREGLIIRQSRAANVRAWITAEMIAKLR